MKDFKIISRLALFKTLFLIIGVIAVEGEEADWPNELKVRLNQAIQLIESKEHESGLAFETLVTEMGKIEGIVELKADLIRSES